MTIAVSFEPFLREFQTSKPMFPFLHAAVEDLTRELMGRFIKPSVLEGAKSTYKLTCINVDTADNCVKLQHVNIGVAARHALSEARVKDIDADKYRSEAKNCLAKIVQKIIERSPLKY